MKNIILKRENKKISLDYNYHFANLVAVNQSLSQGAQNQYQSIGLTYVDVPEIVGITGACENVDTLFKVSNHRQLPLFFTQTGQLALEQALQTFSGVWTVIHSGRDEEEEDSRHLRQFRLTEEEFDCTNIGLNRDNYDEEKMFESMLVHIQNSIQAMIKEVLKNHGRLLEKKYFRDIDSLNYAANRDFLRISYQDAVRLLNKNNFGSLQFGDDLKADHEALIVQLLNKKHQLPVLITHYPKEIKFFNMKVSQKNPAVVLSADCIMPYSGEATGSAVREHEFDKLNERLITSNMYRLHISRGGKYQDFAWYLDIMKNKKTNPHAGYGIGNERILQYIFGLDDIRPVSIFSLLNEQTGDWDKKRYGQAAIHAQDKKNILLTIGKKADKNYLLPVIKRISKKSNYILYATEHTHKFLKINGITTALVYKISQIGQTPNIADFLNRHIFDLIINIPGQIEIGKKNELTDGKLIRRGAVNTGVTLITDADVAGHTLDKMYNQKSITQNC